MSTLPGTLLQFLFYLLMFGCSFWTAYQVAARFFPLGPASVRWTGTIVTQCWLLVFVFHTLAAVSLFQLPVALIVLAALAAAASIIRPPQVAPLQTLIADVRQIRAHGMMLMRPPFGWIFMVIGFLIGLRLVRSLLAPPLGWDALTYHLPKAVLWIQAQGYADLPGPGANAYYRYFQTGGDLLWAWTMLPGPGDLLLGITGLLLWLALLLVLSSILRLVQQNVLHASLAALTIAATPAILQYLSAAYVDTILLVYLLSATFFLAQWLRSPQSGYALFAAAAFGLASATKLSALPVSAAGILIILLFLPRIQPARSRISLVASCLLVASIAMPDYVKAWSEAGSPFYPFTLNLGSWISLPGDPHFVKLQSGALHTHEPMLSGFEYFNYLFLESIHPWGHLNFGLGGLVLMVAAMWGLLNGFRHQSTRGLTTLVCVFASLSIVPLLLDSASIYHTKLWAPVVGRLFLPAFGLLVALAGRYDGRWFLPLWMGAAVLNAYFSLPHGLGRVDLEALAAWIPWILAGTTIGVLAFLVRRRIRPSWVVPVLVFLSLLIPVSQLGGIRSEYRYRYYQATADHNDPVFDVHQLNPYYSSAWPLWQFLDTDRRLNLAVTAGWDGIGHNWYWQPLFGSRFQNRLEYVPITVDSTMIRPNERTEILRRADFPSWLRRLVEGRYNALVLLGPGSIERDWTREHPFLFTPLVNSVDQLHVALAVDSLEAAGFLKADTCRHRASATSLLP